MKRLGPRRIRFVAVIALVVLAALAALAYRQTQAAVTVTDVPISEILAKADNHELRSVRLEGDMVYAEDLGGQHYAATKESGYALSNVLHRDAVVFTVQSARPNLWLIPLGLLLPILLVGGLWYASSRQGGIGNPMPSFGQSRARRFDGERSSVTFADVAGVVEAKTELSEVVIFLKEPDRFRAMGARIPRGVLLVGPPGTGKTLMAKALAGEASVPFFSISGSEFVEMFVGVGASRVRDLFRRAQRHAPCIVFIDEIDAVGRQRGNHPGGSNDEREQTLNQLLVEMDGFDTNSEVVIIAATNRPDILDRALLRPGRFDRQVSLDAPDVTGRRAILAVHARGKPLAQDADLDGLARRTAGFSGADLANVINEATILATRERRGVVNSQDLDEAVLRVVAGPERKSRILSEDERRVIAVHEVGHALVTKFLCTTDEVHKISIVSRGQALGITVQSPTDDRYLMTRTELLARMSAIMGGRAAEEIVFGEVTTGAQQDIERVSATARRMVCELGMGGLGQVTYGRREDVGLLGQVSDPTAARIDEAVAQLTEEAYGMALATLDHHRTQLERIASHLQKVETIDAAQFERLLAEEPALDLDLDRILS